MKLDPLYLITDRNAPPSGDLPRALEAAFAGGVRFVQFREKDLAQEERLSLGREVASLADEHGARLLVNGDPELAEALGAVGVHLGKGTVSVSTLRSGGYSGLIGYSAHSGVEAAGAFAQGADFVTLSPVFPTNSKFSSGPALMPSSANSLSQAAPSMPWAAWGLRTPPRVLREARTASRSSARFWERTTPRRRRGRCGRRSRFDRAGALLRAPT